MNTRGVAAHALVSGTVLAIAMGASSPAAHPDPVPSTLDLVSSAQPTTARPSVLDTAYDDRRARGDRVKADAVATTSATCDGCAGESATLQVLYVPRAREARLDNSATVWTQECADCTGTALSVQVVVLRGHPVAVPNNRALSLTAACAGCRTAAAAFQVVVVADRAGRLSGASMAELRVWFGEQVRALRALVAAPPDSTPTPTPTPSPSPTPTSTPTSTLTGEPTPTAVPTDRTIDPPSPTDRSGRRKAHRRAVRDANAALAELSGLVTDELDVRSISADVEVGH